MNLPKYTVRYTHSGREHFRTGVDQVDIDDIEAMTGCPVEIVSGPAAAVPQADGDSGEDGRYIE